MEGSVSINGQAVFSAVLDIYIKIEVNQHGILRARGILDLMKEGARADWIGAAVNVFWNSEGQELPVFTGYITQYQIKWDGGIAYLAVTGLSGSIRFDQQERIRMFQRPSMTYGDVLNTVSGNGRGIIGAKGKDKRLDFPLLQYKETDWQFLKRIAGKLGTVVIPDVTNVFPQVSVGIVDGKQFAPKQTGDYVKLANFKRFRERRSEGIPSHAFVEYKITVRENYQLCDKVQMEGREYLVVQKECRLEQGAMEFTYWLGGEQGRCQRIQNDRICGLALRGKVLEAQGEKVKINLDMDEGENPPLSEMYLFDYVPITGNIMYSMPEPGAAVSLYFPGTEEKGMVINCIQGSLAGRDRDKKLMELPSGEMLGMAPGELAFSAKDGNAMIWMRDKRGIRLISQSKICLDAKGKIRIVGRNITLVSQSRIVMADKDNDGVKIEGKQIGFYSPKYMLSAVRHKTVKQERKMGDYLVIRDLDAIACRVMGGLLSGELEGMDANIQGGIPEILDTEKSFMDGLSSVSWHRK